MRLSAVLADLTTLPIDVDGETLNVTYAPSSLTPELEDQYMAEFETQRTGGALAKYLANVVTQWDLVDDEGEPVAPTEEILRTLPVKFLGKVFEAIAEDINPQKKTGKSFAGTSPRKG